MASAIGMLRAKSRNNDSGSASTPPIILCSRSSTAASYGGASGGMRMSPPVPSGFYFRSTMRYPNDSESEAQESFGERHAYAPSRTTSPGDDHRQTVAGAVRPARSPLGAADPVGAQARLARLPGAAGPVRRHVVERAARPPERTGRGPDRRRRRRRVLRLE